jgi:hypothetical protein
MSLWGNLDNISVAATSRVWLNYSTGIVTATGGNFGQVGYAKTGDVIKFGARTTNGTYFGDAVIIGITSANQLSIGRTCALTGVAIANTSYTINEQPMYLIKLLVLKQQMLQHMQLIMLVGLVLEPILICTAL